MADTLMQRYSRADPYNESPSPIDSSAVRTGYSGYGNDAMTNAIQNWNPGNEWSNKGVPASIENQVLPARTPAHPMENYFGSISSQEEYRPALMQYLAAGGKRMPFMTGNWEHDAPQIEAVVNATMTPEQQMKRREIEQRNAELEEARKARIQIAKDKEAARQREVAAKQEAAVQKAQSIGREDKLTAHSVLAGALGPDYAKTDKGTLDAMGVRIASKAKAMLNTEKGKGLSLEEAMQKQIDQMVLNRELVLTEATGIPLLRDLPIVGELFGAPEKVEFRRQAPSTPTAAPAPNVGPAEANSAAGKDWIARAQADPRNKGATLEAIIAAGKKYGKIK